MFVKKVMSANIFNGLLSRLSKLIFGFLILSSIVSQTMFRPPVSVSGTALANAARVSGFGSQPTAVKVSTPTTNVNYAQIQKALQSDAMQFDNVRPQKMWTEAAPQFKTARELGLEPVSQDSWSSGVDYNASLTPVKRPGMLSSGSGMLRGTRPNLGKFDFTAFYNRRAPNSFVLDNEARFELQRKYPHLKMPAIYQDLRYNRSEAMSANLPFVKSFITYDPVLKFDQDAWEFAMLHEIGHYNFRYIGNISKVITIMGGPAILAATFLDMVSWQYGIPAAIFAPKLFRTLYLRFIEEPYADDFAIKHARSKDILVGGFRIFEENLNQGVLRSALYDKKHPLPVTRILKLAWAANGFPSYSRFIRTAVVFVSVKKAVEMIYEYRSNLASVEAGIAKIEEIQSDFDKHCDEQGVPAEGRSIYKAALDFVLKYLLQLREYFMSTVRSKSQAEVEKQLIDSLVATDVQLGVPRPEAEMQLVPLIEV